MKLTMKQDVEAPIAFVYATLTDFESWERSAMRRGADITRTDTLRVPAPGMGWIAKFFYRGRDRMVTIRVDALDAPNTLALSGVAAVVDGQVKIDLMDMAAKRTRLQIDSDLTPKTFGARLYLQSLKLSRARVEKTMGSRLVKLAAEIEERYRASLRG